MRAPLHDIHRPPIRPYYALTMHLSQNSHLVPDRHSSRFEGAESKYEICMKIAIMHLPVLRRSLPVLSGRSPGLEVAGSLHAALPSPAVGRVVLQSSFPHLQWRNRAGSSPDFPVMPWWAPETDFVIPQRNRTDVVLASASKSDLASKSIFWLDHIGTAITRRSGETRSFASVRACTSATFIPSKLPRSAQALQR